VFLGHSDFEFVWDLMLGIGCFAAGRELGWADAIGPDHNGMPEKPEHRRWQIMHKGIIATVLLLQAAAAFGAQDAPARLGPYGRLDPKKLSDTLRSLQMTELLQEVLGSQPASAAAATGGDLAVADQKVQLAQKTADPVEKDRLMKEAVDTYRKIGAEKPRTEDDRWSRTFEARMRLVDVFRSAVEPLAIRLMYLQGAEEDRKMVVAMTEEPVKVLRDLKREVDDTVMDYRQATDKKNFVVYQRSASTMKERIDGVGAYMRLYRGLALPETASERKTLLNEVVSALSPYAEGDDESEGKYRASLLIGMAMRELGQHDQAAAKLAQAASEKAPAEVRLQAMFEIIHNRTEQGKYDQVPGEIESFRKAAAAILGSTPEAELRVDVQAALLLDDMYETQAAGEKDPAKIKDLRARGQKPLLDFLQKYPSPDVAEEFLDVVGWKYRDRQDRGNLSAIVLVALARTERARHTDAGNIESLKLLDLASDANDPVSSMAGPYVLRESATLLYNMKRPRDAGKRFARLAGLTRDANEAFQASLNATVCFYNAYESASKQKSLTPDLQDELLASLESLTSRWGSSPDTGPWFFVMGKAYAEKAQAAAPRSGDRAKYLRKAVEALEKTPASLPEGPDARYRALEARLRLLREDPKAPDVKTQAEALVAKMKAFADDARKARDAAKDKDLVEQWTDWGSRSAVGAVQVRYEFLKEQDAALRDLPAVLDDWKGAPVRLEAKDWEIRVLVESADSAKIAQAIARVDEFRKQFPQEAESVIHQVVERIQDRIRSVRMDPDAKGELDRLCKAYLDFSGELYDRSLKADPNQAYAARQMYADALWLAGDGGKSLKLWQECASEDSRRTEARGKAVDEEIDKHLKDLTVARRSEKELDHAVQDYQKLLKDKALDAELGRGRAIQDALQFMKQANEPEERDRRMAVVAGKLAEGYKAAAAALKKQSQVDAMNILGLARACRLLKQYPDAMKNYNQLGKGIDRQSFGDFYWEVQLELCQTALEAYRADKAQMRALSLFILQLRGEDGAMGGRAGLFNQIDFDAKKAVE
jgi:hypothetical protein